MNNVVCLDTYREIRRKAGLVPLTERQWFDLSIRSHCVDAVTGGELAGVPSVQLMRSAPAGQVFWSRLSEGQLYYVPDSDVEWQTRRGWELVQARLVIRGRGQVVR